MNVAATLGVSTDPRAQASNQLQNIPFIPSQKWQGPLYTKTNSIIESIAAASNKAPIKTGNPIGNALWSIWNFVNPTADHLPTNYLTPQEEQTFASYLNERRKLEMLYSSEDQSTVMVKWRKMQDAFEQKNPALAKKINKIPSNISNALGGNVFIGFVAPQLLAMGTQKAAETFFQADNKLGAQTAVTLSTIFGSIPGMLIGGQMFSHDFASSDYKIPPSIKALSPLLRLSILLSHNVAPILDTIRNIVDFDGVVGTKESNMFGKVLDFVTSGFGLLSFSSMVGFSLNHIHTYNQFKESSSQSSAQRSAFKWPMRFQMFGIVANAMAAATNLLGSFVGTLYLRPQMDKLRKEEELIYASLEPQVKKIEQFLSERAQLIETSFKAGKLTAEQAKGEIQQLELIQQSLMKRLIENPKVRPLIQELESKRKNLEAVQWLVQLGSVIGSAALGLQMASQTGQGLISHAAKLKADQPKLKWHQSIWKAGIQLCNDGIENHNANIADQNIQNGKKTPLKNFLQEGNLNARDKASVLGKLIVGFGAPAAILGYTGLETIATGLGSNPFFNSDNNSLVKAAKGITENPLIRFVASNTFA